MPTMPVLQHVEPPKITPIIRGRSDLPDTFISTDTNIEIITGSANCRLYFTTDGSEPDPSGSPLTSGTKTYRYRGSLKLSPGQRTVRAIAVARNGPFKSAITTRTFIVKDVIGGRLTLPNPGQSVDLDLQSHVSVPHSMGSDSIDLANIETPPTTYRTQNGVPDTHRTYDMSSNVERTLDHLEAEFIRRSRERAASPNGLASSTYDQLTDRQSPLHAHLDSRRTQSPVFVNHDNPEVPIDVTTPGRRSPIRDRVDAASPLGRRSPMRGRRSPTRNPDDLEAYFRGSSRNPFIEDIDDNGYPLLERYQDFGSESEDTEVDNFFQQKNKTHRQAWGTEPEHHPSNGHQRNGASLRGIRKIDGESSSGEPMYEDGMSFLSARGQQRVQFTDDPDLESEVLEDIPTLPEPKRRSRNNSPERPPVADKVSLKKALETDVRMSEEDFDRLENRSQGNRSPSPPALFTHRPSGYTREEKWEGIESVNGQSSRSHKSSTKDIKDHKNKSRSKLKQPPKPFIVDDSESMVSSTTDASESTCRASTKSSSSSTSALSKSSSSSSVSSASSESEKSTPMHIKHKEQKANKLKAEKMKEKEEKMKREREKLKREEKRRAEEERNRKARQKAGGPRPQTAGYGPRNISIRNDSGTQVNAWGNMTPDQAMDYAKTHKGQNKKQNGGRKKWSEQPFQVNGVSCAFAEQTHCAAEEEDEDDVDGIQPPSYPAVQAQSGKFSYSAPPGGASVAAESQAEQHSIGGFFKKIFKGWGADDDDGKTKTVGKCGKKGSSLPYSEIQKKCLKSRKLWEDPDFSADATSLYLKGKGGKGIEWKRPKDLCSKPEMFVGGASRFDVKQGVLGNCWLLAAVASLATDEKLLHRVVPPEQSFSKQYIGAFRFYFWQYGHWVEVVVDDRLPVKNGKLLYMHSDTQNEFWSPLLEKAYAKLCGCYEALSGGLTSEALTDFCGGLVERFNFHESLPDNMFQILLKARERGSLMGCSIDASADQIEAELENGLIIGHAYSITDVKEVETSRGVVRLLRVRNPWGNEAEWTGAWGDKAPEWKTISEKVRKKIDINFEHDGEFWMSFEDFANNFQRVEICNLVAEGGSDKRWNTSLMNGAWKRKVNAGGCRNHPETYWTNPQYRIKVVDPDDDDEDDLCTVVVALMQCGRRKLIREGKANLVVGYDVYQVDGSSVKPLEKKFFEGTGPVGSSPTYINMRELTGRLRLPPGDYSIVPTTFEPNEEADFVVRVFTEKESAMIEADEPTGFVSPTGGQLQAQSDTSNVNIPAFFFSPVQSALPAHPASQIKAETDTSNVKIPAFFYSPVRSTSPRDHIEAETHTSNVNIPAFFYSPVRSASPRDHIDEEKNTSDVNIPAFFYSPVRSASPRDHIVAEAFFYSPVCSASPRDHIDGEMDGSTAQYPAFFFSPVESAPPGGRSRNGHPVQNGPIQKQTDKSNVQIPAFFFSPVQSAPPGARKNAVKSQEDKSTVQIPAFFFSPVQSAPPLTSPTDIALADEAEEEFKAMSGEDLEVDAHELCGILNRVFAKGYDFGEFDVNLCRSMVAIKDLDHTGMLGLGEFKSLWMELKHWETIFKQFDVDNSGHFNSFELREALKHCGYQTSNATFTAIVMRYSDRDGFIHFDDFVACIIKLKSMFETFLQKAAGQNAMFELDEFIQMTMYS